MKTFTKKIGILLVLCWGLIPTLQAQGPMLDPAFLPTQVSGPPGPLATVYDVVRQPDGKLILGGNFTAVNGSPAQYLCRLLPNGQIDASFNAPAPDQPVYSLALQADGKLLLGGEFTAVGGQPRGGVARLQPNGAPDAAFVPPFGSSMFASTQVRRIIVQSGYGILVLGSLIPPTPTGTGAGYLARLTESSGALDSGFVPGFTPYGTRTMLVQSDGRIVFGGAPHTIGGQQAVVWRTLPDGAIDPNFTPLPGSDDVYVLAQDLNTGQLYADSGPTSTYLLRLPQRLLPNGGLDQTFDASLSFPAFGYSIVLCMTVQPNGRLLLGGQFPINASDYAGMSRLLPNGGADTGFNLANGPSASVNQLLVEPDGALVAAGYFSNVGGLPISGLARLRDAHVLSVSKQEGVKLVGAWPVPAHDVLNLRLEMAGDPQRVELLDALGRTVISQAVTQADMQLNTGGLTVGSYLLRVHYLRSGSVVRRVTIN